MSRASSLTALVGSRICHDLISPLGAIGNGIELLGMGDMADTPEFALVRESITSANARIRFFRIAYGAATEGQAMSRSEVASTLNSVARGGRLSYFWEVAGEQPKINVRIAFLLLQCFETAMPYGGEVHISLAGSKWEARAEADRMKIDAALWDSLTDTRARLDVPAAQVQFALLPEVLAETGKTLAIKINEGQIVAQF